MRRSCLVLGGNLLDLSIESLLLLGLAGGLALASGLCLGSLGVHLFLDLGLPQLLGLCLVNLWIVSVSSTLMS